MRLIKPAMGKYFGLALLIGLFALSGAALATANELTDEEAALVALFTEKSWLLEHMNKAAGYLSIEEDALNLAIGTFLTRAEVPDFAKRFPGLGPVADKADGGPYWVIQFPGIIGGQDRRTVERGGLEILEYVPNNAYLVRGSRADVSRLYLQRVISWMGAWLPAYRIQPELLLIQEAEDLSRVPVRVITFPGVDHRLVSTAIRAAGGTIETTVQRHRGHWKYQVGIPSRQLARLAGIADVQWVEIILPWELHNNIARSSGNITTGRGATAGPVMNVDAVWAKGIRGENQVIAAADTGLDTGNLSTIHEDFEDQADLYTGATRILSAYGLSSSRPGDWSDPNGHGTHTSGSIAGNGWHSGSNPATNSFPSTCYAGTAPQAQLVFQAVGSSSGSLDGIPSDLHNLYQQPYTDGARVHSNSWGAAYDGQYTDNSMETDDFVWDNPLMVITFSAGNSGYDGNRYNGFRCATVTTPDGVIDLDTIGAPGTAKNIITVGASDNYRPTVQYEYPQNTCNTATWGWFNSCNFSVAPIYADHMADYAAGMVAFSSRGPCDDPTGTGNSLGRIKPDIVAPGSFVLSTKTQLVDWFQWGQCGLTTAEKDWYIYQGGTSMSNPLTAGTCGLIQQYYQEGWYGDGTKNSATAHTPTAALVKATLLNGAWDMTPGQYGTGSYQEVDARPDNNQGWGRVDLYNTLYFSGDGRNFLFDDYTSGLEKPGSEAPVVTYTVCNQSSSEELRFTLVWTDPPAATGASVTLVNNLDLEVTAPDGTTVYYPNRGTGPDNRNNVEGIDVAVADLQTGEYTVRVIGTDIPGNSVANSTNQPYALVISGGGVKFGTCCSSFPPAPSSLDATTPAENTIRLDWSSVAQADYYRIYRSAGGCPGGTFTLLEDTSGTGDTHYLDTPVNAGTTYSYKVTAVNSEGCESETYSPCADATAWGDCTSPPTFAGLQSVTAIGGGTCCLLLEWNAATNTCTGDGSGITYNVYRSTSGGFTPGSGTLLAACVTGTEYYDTTVQAGVTHYYIVRAEDNTANGDGPCAYGNQDSNMAEFSGVVGGGTLTLLDQDWETSYTGWSYLNQGTATEWHATNAEDHTTGSGQSAHCGNTGSSYINSADCILVSPGVSIPGTATSATLTFYHQYDIERRYDGTQLYISTTSESLGTIVSNPSPAYDSTIRSTANSPIAGQNAWCIDQNSWEQVTVNLAAYIGQTIYIQWRFVSDTSTTAAGYYLDDILVTCDAPSCTTAPDDVQFFNATEDSGQITLEWVNPVDYPAGSTTMIRWSASDYPADSTAGTLLVEKATGSADAKDSAPHSGLNNGTTYYYTCFTGNGGEYSVGRRLAAVPNGSQDWSYVTTATTLVPPASYAGRVFFGSNTREFHGVNATTGGWASGWVPFLTNGAVQSRAPVVPYSLNGASYVVFFACQDGRVYSVNADTGESLWTSAILGDMLQGSPAAIFSQWSDWEYDYLYIGTRNDDTSAANVFKALNIAANGAEEWSFDNGGGSTPANAFGPMNSSPVVDYGRQQVYFATRRRSGGTTDTLWAVNAATGAKVWSADIGSSDGGPIVENGYVYIGNNAGQIYAVDAVTGDLRWDSPLNLNDGAVKDYISIDWTTGWFYVATADTVTCFTDNVTAGQVEWQIVVAGASAPVVVPSLNALYVGSSDGRIHEISLDGLSHKVVSLGEGTDTVGAPAFDFLNRVIHVGTAAGKIFEVAVPF